MDKNIEVEYKTLVSKSEFERLREHFPARYLIDQTNTYYDTVDRQLSAQKIACRIREVNGGFEATVKIKNNGDLTEHTLLAELNDPIIFTMPEFMALWKSVNVAGSLLPIGQCHTMREMVVDEWGELCFDTNTYRGMTDYEIEYEVKTDFDTSFHRFMRILALENIEYVPSSSKMKRSTQL